MEDIIAPVGPAFTFDFETFLEKEMGLYLNNKRTPAKAAICKYFLRGTCHAGQQCNFRHAKEKSVMCKHWLRALCKKNDNCEFLHEYDLRRMPECWFYANFKECSNAECMFLHIDPESKVKECVWYNRGFCKHGPTCRNKHVRKVACQPFLTGFCPRGPDCPLGHPKYEVPKFDDRVGGMFAGATVIAPAEHHAMKARERERELEEARVKEEGGEVGASASVLEPMSVDSGTSSARTIQREFTTVVSDK